MKKLNYLFLTLFSFISINTFSQSSTSNNKKDTATAEKWEQVPTFNFILNTNRYSTIGFGFCMQFINFESFSKGYKKSESAGISIDLIGGKYEKGHSFGGLSSTLNYNKGFATIGLTTTMYNSKKSLLDPRNTSLTPFLGLNVTFFSVSFGYEFFPSIKSINERTNNIRLPAGFVVKFYLRPTALLLLLVGV